MNAELLKEFLVEITENENYFEVQKKLNSLESSLNNLAGTPHDQNHQSDVSKNLDELENAVTGFEEEFSPKDKQRFHEINAHEFFSSDMIQKIKQSISKNSLSPAVVRDHVNDLTEKRRKYLNGLESLIVNLTAIGIEITDLEEKETEIGFQIPRDIFNNNLDELINELRAIKRIIRTFSEVTTGQIEEIKVGQISTSDPLIFLSQSLAVVVSLSTAVDWALSKWREIEEIRNIRAQTAKLQAFTEQETAKIFDKKISSVIDDAIKEKVTELLNKSDLNDARKNELGKALSDSLKSLLARIERGMTIEIRMLDYSDFEDTETEEEESEEGNIKPEMHKLQALQNKLKFPIASQNPILSLPSFKAEKKE